MGRTFTCLLALAALAAGCGDDDDTASTEASTTTTAAAGEVDEGLEEFCAAARAISDAEDVPAPEQIQRYQELAPEEIQEAAQTAGGPFIEAAGDPVATFAVFGRDEVEAALDELEAFEAEHCGIEADDAPSGPQAAEEGSNLVEVVAREYTFEHPAEIPAGPTSFRLVNEGAEAHFLLVVRIPEGTTLDEALAFEGDPMEAGLMEGLEGGESGVAAPDGQDEEFANLTLEPGQYGLLCFIPGPEGTPHAFMGMATSLTVT